MNNLAKAFAPANISCVFKIHEHTDPRWMGSYGNGFTLKEGVTVELSRSATNNIVFNNKDINIAPVKRIIDSLTNEKVTVCITSSLPLGCGFGLSGASALATAYALNDLLELKKDHKELAVIAHTAEVESRTGLGDVTNQYYGGLLIKFRSSPEFIVKKLAFNDTPVHCTYFNELSTETIITSNSLKKKINNAADVALTKIQNLLNENNKIIFGDIISLSKEFAVTSGLLANKKVIETIQSIEKNNGHASMIMLGNAVFSDIPFQGSMKLTISDTGAHLM